MDFIGTDGTPHRIVLPFDWLTSLLMTLPRMLQTALDARFPDGSLRFVHQLGAWRIEQAAASAGLILKLCTPDGFEVAFALNDHDAGLTRRCADGSARTVSIDIEETKLMNVMTEVHPYLDGKPKRMLIGGKWLEAASGKTFETRNPATGEVLANVAEGDAEDIDRAVAAARAAFNGPWSKFKPAERQRLLLRLADLVERDIEEFAALDTLDMGAPITRTRGGRQRALGMLRFYAGMATALHGETIENSLPGEYVSFTLKEPVGVVGAIIPWNGPLSASIWKIGPALATGCTVVLKPAEEAPLTPLRLAELCLEAGVPPGVVNVVPGYGETAGAALAAHIRTWTRWRSPARISPASRSSAPRPAT